MAKKRVTVTPAMRTEIINLRAGGMRRPDIAAKFRVALSTIDRALKGGRVVPVGSIKNSPELTDIYDRIAELQQRAKDIVNNSRGRQQLRRFVENKGLTRADVKWVHDQMPLTRITRAHREARLAVQKNK